MIMSTPRWLLAALTALAVMAPANGFIATARVGVPSITGHHPSSSPRYGVASTRPATVRTRGGACLSMSTDTAVEQKGLVTVYHKETCPYCKKALQLLEEGYALKVSRVDVLEGEDSEKKIKQMKTFSGRNTVPQIFFNSDHIGGNDDLQKLHEEGKLEELVAKVRAEAPGMMKDSWFHPWY